MTKQERRWIDYHGNRRFLASVCHGGHVKLAILFVVALFSVSPTASAIDSRTGKGISRRVKLEGPASMGTVSADVVQVLDRRRDPKQYFIDVGSVVCGGNECEVVTVRIYFDPIGNYERYELSSRDNLTKLGHRPFSRDDHKKLHQILSDPYSPLKSIGWDEITMPKSSNGSRKAVDGISGATPLTQRGMVVVGAAYTCFTLWHWSHGEVTKVVREMTVKASDKQDLIRYLENDDDKYVIVGMERWGEQNGFEVESITEVVQVMRYGSLNLVDPALRFLGKGSSEKGVDHFFCCCEDDRLLENSDKRVRLLEALRKTTLRPDSGYLDRLSGWLSRADSYYEVHLLFTLLEREESTSDEAVRGAMSLLEDKNSLVVRRSYRYLKAQTLSDSQQEKLAAFERANPDR